MRRAVVVLLILAAVLPSAWGWGAPVHRMITLLALDGLPPEAPAWLRDPGVRFGIAFDANQADRWRGWNSDYLKHANEPEHFLDADLLDQFGLTLETMPRLRGEYLKALILAKAAHPDKVEPYDAGKDPARTHEWPGFVLQAVLEHYAKLQAAYNQVRILELVNEPARQAQLAEAREIAIYQAGALSHFVGDIAQPLHTTKHYNGWLGDNPQGYKWRDRFHAYIDEGFAEKHNLTYAALKPQIKYDVKMNAADPWEDVLAYFKRSHAQMEPLYTLERDGKLDGPEGEQLITRQLGDASAVLSAMIWAAYTSAEPTDAQLKSWVRYDAFNTGDAPSKGAATTQPATRPDGE